MEKNALLEKWDKLIEHDGAPVVSQKETMAQLLESEEEYMLETGSVNADMAQYTPILVPAVRRIFPNLLANEIVGVQALKMPTGYAYALRYGYNAGAAAGTQFGGISNTDRGTFNRGLTNANQSFQSIAVLLTDTTFQPSGIGSGAVTGIGGTAVAAGNILYTEPGKMLFSAASVSAAINAGNLAPGKTIALSGAQTAQTIVAVFNNEAGYNLIFKNFAGPWTTAIGEQLGNSSSNDIASVKMTLERVNVEAQTRKLKAEYTLELAQDLKNVHGIDAEAELINILEYEISAQLDRELVDLINTKATVVPGWDYGTNFNNGSVSAIGTFADGRWEQEKFRTLYTKILREANQIAIQTRRGAANFIIVSANVAAALESLSGFMYSAVPGSVKTTLGIAKIGTLDGRFSVYLDTFATYDYVTLGYKGSSAFDTGIIYCPYVPLMLQKVTDPGTFQPKIAFMTRDAITGNLWGAEKYYRSFSVDFTGSSLGQGSIWGAGPNMAGQASTTWPGYTAANF